MGLNQIPYAPKSKGSTGSYGFQQLSDLAILVEEHFKQGHLLEAKAYIVDMQKCMGQLYRDTEPPNSQTALNRTIHETTGFLAVGNNI